MSRKKWLLIIALIILAALIIYPYLTWNDPYAYLDDIPGYADQAKTIFLENWKGFVTGISGAITGVGYLANKVISRKNEAISTLSREKNKLETQIYNEGTIEAFKEKYGEDAFVRVETLSAEVTRTKATLEKKKTEITKLKDTIERGDKIRSNLEDERLHFQKRVKKLETELAIERGEIEPPVRAP